jgi:hypothetical protein
MRRRSDPLIEDALMSETNSTEHKVVEEHDFASWPRDFDFRAQYAEQQELFGTQGQETTAVNHTKGTNHA